jgi:outer membrane protein assembly factor BamB
MLMQFRMTLRFTKVLALLFVTVSANAEELTTKVWPQWRGPHRDGSLVDTELPKGLADLKQVWKVELGPSYSGPIVDSDRVFVTETKDKKVEIVRALDRKTGKELWKQQWEGSISVPFFAKANGDWIRSTPAYDGERLYVAGIREVLVCLDGTTGKELWRLDFAKELKSEVPSFGCASSPLVLGDHVYIQAGGFCKIDKLSGAIKWRVLDDGGGMSGGAFSSPYFTELNGVPQFVVQTRTTLTGVDPKEGEVLWSQKVPAFRGMNIVTPTVHKNAVFTSAYGGRSFLFATTKNAADWSVKESWTNKAQGYMSSPLIVKDHLYIHLRNQRFACINLETGESTWTTTPFGKYWSTVTDGKKILALDEKGELLLIRANPEKFEIIDRRKMADDSWAHIAVVGKEIFIRALNHVAVYQWE